MLSWVQIFQSIPGLQIDMTCSQQGDRKWKSRIHVIHSYDPDQFRLGLGEWTSLFFKARSNGGKTLLLLHQETNPGATSFSIEGRLNLRIQGQHIIKMIRGYGHSLLHYCQLNMEVPNSFWVHKKYNSLTVVQLQALSDRKVSGL